MKKTRREWYATDSSGLFPLQQRTVYEREDEQRPVLYGPKGEPLTYPRKPMGFDPTRAHRQ